MALREGYSLSFKLLMEGTEVPFKSGEVVCTPGGVEASIEVYSNEFVFDLIPKTAVQIWYREWTSTQKKQPWRMMFDGFFSKFHEHEEAMQGRMLSLVCRDFRMDIRKAPAAMAWEKEGDLTTNNYYNSMGIFQTWVVKGVTPPYQEGQDQTKGTKKGSKGRPIRTYGSLGINDISEMLRYIAGSASGKGLKKQDNGEYIYSAGYGAALKDNPKTGSPESGLFLDAIIRGIWLESVGGTTISAYMNKRMRVDKRILVPINRAGYNFWTKQSAAVNMASYFMGNARFTSIEAAIMRLAGVFSSRPYACNTPSLIPIGDDENGKPNPAVQYVMDEDVRDFLVKRSSAEFGAPYILNETMILPPLEFTAPPNCNLVFPPMYEHIEWHHDFDMDFTRGYFSQNHILTSKGSGGLSSQSIQIPNALFDTQSNIGSQLDKNNRIKPPITFEERKNGINVLYGNVAYRLGADDAVSVIRDRSLNKRAKNALNDKISEIQQLIKDSRKNINPSEKALSESLTASQKIELKFQLKAKKAARDKLKLSSDQAIIDNTTNALQRHALIKFLNSRYSGRVLTCDMQFNPYIMCGFPSIVVSPKDPSDKKPMKDIIGMVQQVKHTIFTTTDQADASTSIVMNNARFMDEATDMDPNGSQLFMKATDTAKARVDSDTLDYVNPDYFIPEPKAKVEYNIIDAFYDLRNTKDSDEYIFSKDLLTLTAEDIANGERNQIYIDDTYEPNKIAKFYRDVLQHKHDSFMVGRTTNFSDAGPVQSTKFMYDTIHEAITGLRENRSDLLTDYRSCIDYIYRTVCSADAFYHGILGLSVLRTTDDNGNSIREYVNKVEGFKDNEIHDSYYGVTTKLWDSGKIDGLKRSESSNGLMTDAGQFSSFNETMPITAFIQERRDKVEQYVREIKNSQNFVQRKNP